MDFNRFTEKLQDAMRGTYPTWSDALRHLGAGGWVTRNMAAGAARTEWERGQWDRCDLDALTRLADATLHVDVEGYLPAVRVPTLVLAPAQSALTPLADQFQIRTTIPHAEIEVFEGRGHNIYLEEPQRCTARSSMPFQACRFCDCGCAVEHSSPS